MKPRRSTRRDVKLLLTGNQTQNRREQAQELRSIRRQSILVAKRRKSDPGSAVGEHHSPQWSREQLQTVLLSVQQSPLPEILPHLTDLRRILSFEDSPVEEVVEKARLGPRLIQLLAAPNDEIQIEAAWCITNIASSHTRHTEHILDAAPQLISFLSAPNTTLQEQSLWALGNIAGDNTEFREKLHANGILLPVLRLLQNPPSAEIARTAAWTISNLARGERTPAKPFLSAAGEVIAALRGEAAISPMDAVLRVEAAWILAFLSAKDDESNWTLVHEGLVPALVQALVDSRGEDPLCTPVLRSLGNMVSGLQEWADAVLEHSSFLACLGSILSSQDPARRALVKEAAWVTSNVAAGRQEHRDALFSQGIGVSLISLLVSGQLDMQREAAFAVWNLVSHGGDRLGGAVGTPGVLDAFVGLLSVPDASVVRCALSFLQLVCEAIPHGPRLVEKHGGLEAIDDVHYSGQEPELSAAAASIVDRFFGMDYEEGSDEDEDGGGGNVEAETMGATTRANGGRQELPGYAMPGQCAAGMGRGAHLTRPAWMQNAPP